jgi:hypothetical protein
MNPEEALRRLHDLMVEFNSTDDPIDRGRLATSISAFAKDQLMPAMSAERLKAVDQMHRARHSYSSIAKTLGISTSRAHQLVMDPR